MSLRTLTAIQLVFLSLTLHLNSSLAQDESTNPTSGSEEIQQSDEVVKVADKVDVEPVNSDKEIANRLATIFDATNWFIGSEVKVDGGVAFLTGSADTEIHRTWAEQTAMKTTDVVAVVNRMKIADKPIWNFSPAISSLKELARETTSMLPLVVVAFLISICFYYIAIGGAQLTRWLTRNSIESGLLRQVSANVVGVIIFIVGIYIGLRVSGLTRLAVTLLGGTGLVGLALGFAFRDIAENYLASILISLNNPFRMGDLVEIGGHKGYVRKVTTRGTVLNSEDGNQIQIPNSMVYKGTILNHTATPLTRRQFMVGIGLEDSIPDAQAIIMQILNEHKAVVAEPAPVVLVDSLGSATVNMKCQFWLDQIQHSAAKVTSSLIRQVMQQLVEAGISLPDEARELIFPQGVPVRLIKDDRRESDVGAVIGRESVRVEAKPKPSASRLSDAEGDLSSDKEDIERVTEGEGAVADETNLLKAS